jgi:Family of unknown function (DUF6152)
VTVRSVGLVLLIMFTGMAARTLDAHHSFAAQYDRAKPHTIAGTVTKIEWTNPHIYLYVVVKGDSCKETEWEVEGMAPNALYRQGWRPDTVKVGERITVEGWLARDGSNLLNMGSATIDGRKIFGGTAQQ